jgi:glutamate--cysteine ligase
VAGDGVVSRPPSDGNAGLIVPGPAPTLTGGTARAWLEDHCLAGRSVGRVGLECEWFCFDGDELDARVEPARTRVALEGVELPGGSVVSFEPGGQLELSGPPYDEVVDAVAAMTVDLEAVSNALHQHGVYLVGMGTDPRRAPHRVVHSARYDAMETYFDADGPAGRVMMCSTAALQVNVDLGEGAIASARWRRAHVLGPVLAASFATSPFLHGRPTGQRSTRLATWFAIDPTRTAPCGHLAIGEWSDYVLDSRVMLAPRADDAFVAVVEPLTFRQWIERGTDVGHPTVDDLAYHLTTLFPPVRARGWLELRFLDAPPAEWWPVAAAVTAILMDDPAASRVADAIDPGGLERWHVAARDGLRDSGLARDARALFVAAEAALRRRDLSEPLADAVRDFRRCFVDRGRCPADDLLDAYEDTGRVALPAGLIEAGPSS